MVRTHRRARQWLVLVTAFALVGSSALVVPTDLVLNGDPSPGTAAAAPPTSRFVAVAPCRLADTRQADGYVRIDASTIEVPVSGRCGLPATLTAASFVVTAVGPSTDGNVTVYPAHLATAPTISNLSTHRWQARANGAIVQVSPAGAVRVHVRGGGAVLLDTAGGFVGATEATAGRFVPMSPLRAFDSRQVGAATKVAAGSVVTVPLPPGVPTDATALAVNLTVVAAAQRGFVTAFPAGDDAGNTSNINFDAVDGARAASSIVTVSPTGVSFLVTAEAHLIVDVTSYFTGDGAVSSTDGLFIPTVPTRVLDTRGTTALGVGVPLYRNGGIDTALASVGAGAALNVTITATGSAGYLVTHAAGTARPPTSSLNSARMGDVAAASWVGATSTTGVRVAVTGMSSHVIVDQFGSFTGAAIAPTLGAPPNVPNATGCLPGVGKLDPTGRWYRQDNTSASTSSIAYYPLSGRRGALAVMGDSLTWQTMSGTMNRLIDAGYGPICADGAVFRATTVVVLRVNSGVDAINRLRSVQFWAAPTVRWVVSIGTNDVGTATTVTAQRARVDTVIAAIGGTSRTVLWMNVRTRRSEFRTIETRFNDTLATTPNVRVIDWSAMVAPSPATYITNADLVHLTATGIARRPVLLADTLTANS